jgi:hypothetical protein
VYTIGFSLGERVGGTYCFLDVCILCGNRYRGCQGQGGNVRDEAHVAWMRYCMHYAPMQHRKVGVAVGGFWWRLVLL